MGGRRAENGTRAALFFHLAPSKSLDKADAPLDYSGEPSTLVEFRLEKTAGGTLLVLTESGFDKLPGDRRLEAFRRNDGGWAEQMKNVENYLSENVSNYVPENHVAQKP
jgi:hypothetical protein